MKNKHIITATILSFIFFTIEGLLIYYCKLGSEPFIISSLFNSIIGFIAFDYVFHSDYPTIGMRIRQVQRYSQKSGGYETRFYVDYSYQHIQFFYNKIIKHELQWTKQDYVTDNGYETKEKAMEEINNYIKELLKNKKVVENVLIKDEQIVGEFIIKDEIAKLENTK